MARKKADPLRASDFFCPVCFTKHSAEMEPGKMSEVGVTVCDECGAELVVSIAIEIIEIDAEEYARLVKKGA